MSNGYRRCRKRLSRFFLFIDFKVVKTEFDIQLRFLNLFLDDFPNHGVAYHSLQSIRIVLHCLIHCTTNRRHIREFHRHQNPFAVGLDR